MHRLAALLAALLLAIQWPLWLGHGGWLRVWELERQLGARQDLNAALRQRNQALLAEISNLHQGSEAIEERARADLHMMRPGETFFQFVGAIPASGAGTSATGTVVLGDPLQGGFE
jgi:cell division protein FtsB